MDGLIKIARTEGPAQLWRGTDLSLAVCVPAIAVYFPLYEHPMQHLQSAGNVCCRFPLCCPVAMPDAEKPGFCLALLSLSLPMSSSCSRWCIVTFVYVIM